MPTISEHIEGAVARVRNERRLLHIEATARAIAAEHQSPDLDQIAECLLREGIRQKVAIEMDHRRH